MGAVTSTQTVSVIATKKNPKTTRSEINKEKFLILKKLRKRMLSEENDNLKNITEEQHTQSWGLLRRGTLKVKQHILLVFNYL